MSAGEAANAGDVNIQSRFKSIPYENLEEGKDYYVIGWGRGVSDDDDPHVHSMPILIKFLGKNYHIPEDPYYGSNVYFDEVKILSKGIDNLPWGVLVKDGIDDITGDITYKGVGWGRGIGLKFYPVSGRRDDLKKLNEATKYFTEEDIIKRIKNPSPSDPEPYLLTKIPQDIRNEILKLKIPKGGRRRKRNKTKYRRRRKTIKRKTKRHKARKKTRRKTRKRHRYRK